MSDGKKLVSSKLVKRLNKEEILRQVIREGRISRAEIAKRTQLSRPCVSTLVEEMIAEGLLQEVGVGDSTGGRKPVLLAYNYQAYAIAGAVYEGSRLDMAVADLKGEFLARRRAQLMPFDDGDRVLEVLAAELEALLRESGMARKRVLGIGIGLPGVTRRQNGTISDSPSTGWMNRPIRQAMEERLGLPVLIDNDVNLMTLGEWVRGVGAGAANLVYIYVGTGIGAGVIVDGQFFRGSREAAGEIGHMLIGPVQSRRNGEFGVFEKHYSAPALRRRAGEWLDLRQDGSIIDILQTHAEGGCERSERLLEEVCRHWAYSLANIISLLDPELLILSGEMIHLQSERVQQMEAWLREWVPAVPRIERARLGEQAGLIGAVHSVLEAFPYHTLLED